MSEGACVRVRGAVATNVSPCSKHQTIDGEAKTAFAAVFILIVLLHRSVSLANWPRPHRQRLTGSLASGTTLVVDRYAYSGAAFTAAKGVPGLDRTWCQVLSQRHLFFLLPTSPLIQACVGVHGPKLPRSKCSCGRL